MADKKTASFVRSLCMGEIEEDGPALPGDGRGEREMLGQVLASVQQLLARREKEFRDWDAKAEMPAPFSRSCASSASSASSSPRPTAAWASARPPTRGCSRRSPSYDGSVALTVGAHSSIGMRGLLLFGTDAAEGPLAAQARHRRDDRRLLPHRAGRRLRRRRASAPPRARDGNDWILNGEKLWITNGGIADFFTVFAKTPAAREEQGALTAFIVTRDMAGVTTGPHEDKMGIRASSTTTVLFDDVRVPAANVLGEVGQGLQGGHEDPQRRPHRPGRRLRRRDEEAHRARHQQAKERQQFGRPIAEFGLIKQKLGQMVVDCYATESVVSMVAGLIDQGYEDYAVEAAISKVFATEALWRTADEALQIAGGNGYMREFPYERALRDCRINRIFEGTNDILRLFIALTAMNDVGAQLKELAGELKGVLDDPIKGFGVLSDYARGAPRSPPVGRRPAHLHPLARAVLKDRPTRSRRTPATSPRPPTGSSASTARTSSASSSPPSGWPTS